MVKKGYHLSIETRKKLSEAHKGKKMPEELRIKLRNVNLGSRHSEEHKKKISLAGMGKIPWNKGLKKEDSESLMKISVALKGKTLSEETKKKMSSVRIGKKMPPRSEEWRKKQSFSHKGQQLGHKHSLGRKHTKEECEKMSIFMRGNKYALGHHHTEEYKEKMRLLTLNRKTPPSTKNTNIELILQRGLDKYGLKYKTHVNVCNICKPDIVFPELKVAIFADGDHWHSPIFNDGKAWKRDKKNNAILSENGWRVIRFWGSEIEIYPDRCVNEIYKVIATMDPVV